MLARHWLYGFAIGGLVVSYAWAQESSEQTQGIDPKPSPTIEDAGPDGVEGAADSNKRAAEQDQPAAQPLQPTEPDIGAPIRPPSAEPTTSTSTKRAEDEMREIAWRDLAAQEGMSYASWAAVVLTAVGVALIWRTLVHTRRAAEFAGAAVEEGRRATSAAEDAVAVTRESAERQLRAYISAHIRNLKIIGKGKQASVTVDMKNHGQTPAKNLRYHAMTAVMPYPLPENFIFPELPGISDSRDTIHPGVTHNGYAWPRRNFTEEEIDYIIKGESPRLYAFGIIYYEDIFGQTRTTEFCISITGQNFGAIRELDEAAEAGAKSLKTEVRFHAADRYNDAT